jgi:hypothetical protein
MLRLDPELLEELVQTIHTLIPFGEPPSWMWSVSWRPSEEDRLVEYGVARFVVSKRRFVRIKVDEPLALVRILHYFESNSHTFKRNKWIRPY